MSLSDISSRLSESIARESNLGNEQKAVLAYAVETVILSILGTLLVITTSSFFHVLIPALIATVFGGTLRRLSGGAHFNTPFKCLIFGAAIYTLIGILSEQMIKFGLVRIELLMPLVIFCLIIAGMLAPVESLGKPIHSKNLKLKLKSMSILFIMLVLIILCIYKFSLVLKVSSVLGITFQCITLLPVFNRRGEVM